MAYGVSIKYQDDEITNMTQDGEVRLLTANKYMEGDLEVSVNRDLTIIEKTVTENGVYDAEDDDADGYDTVTVNVPNTYAAGDEGKVVSNGELVSQTSVTKTANGVYDTTLNDEVNIDVPNTYTASDEGKVVSSGALVGQTSKTVTENGSYDTTLNNEVVVNVQGSGGGGSVLSGATAPSASLGSDGDLYVQKMTLPADVTFVEYLESNGTQYIDTGVVPDQRTDLFCKFLWKANTYVAGVRTGSADSMTNSLLVTAGASRQVGTSKTTSSVSWTSSKITEVEGVPTEVSTHTVRNETGYFVRLDVDETHFLRTGQSNFTANGSFLLFGLRIGGNVNIASAARIYRLTLLQDNIPIADYLPCLDANDVPCMWDNISKNFVYNSGTGTFAYGSTATPDKLPDVLYVKNNGAWVYIGEADGVTT